MLIRKNKIIYFMILCDFLSLLLFSRFGCLKPNKWFSFSIEVLCVCKHAYPIVFLCELVCVNPYKYRNCGLWLKNVRIEYTPNPTELPISEIRELCVVVGRRGAIKTCSRAEKIAAVADISSLWKTVERVNVYMYNKRI